MTLWKSMEYVEKNNNNTQYSFVYFDGFSI